MKTLLLIFALVSFSVASITATEIIDIKEAIKQNLVKCRFYGNSASTHYLKAMKVQIKNLKNQDIRVRIPNGYIFQSGDSSYQDLIITEERILALAPLTTKAYDLYAMCIEKNNSAPGDSVKYKPLKMAEPVLAGLTKIIQDKKYYNSTAQNAVWVLACNIPLDEVAGNPEEGSDVLIKYISEKTGRKIIPPKPVSDYIDQPEERSNYSLEISGFFEFEFQETSAVHVAMFDSNGMIVKELYKNNAVKAGYHKINFTFDATIYNDKLYYIKMIANGEVLISRKLERE